uniref:Uncharacterized protein n=1 Tax=uncultured prokaryote TaxID=198431 RepID=A0A0H5Q650_9ZZZZ|nr:hypothetical protein [uncultured prokaryote]
MFQYVPTWTGNRIGSGATVLNFINVDEETTSYDDVAAQVQVWFESMSNFMPDDTRIQFPREMREIDPATGALIGFISVSALTDVVGESNSVFPAGSGRVVRWGTGSVVGNRRAIGHTYLVPSAGCYTTGGDVQASTILADATAHSSFLSGLVAFGAELAVWSRPFAGDPEATPPKPARTGVASAVTSGQTLIRPTALRTRND